MHLAPTLRKSAATDQGEALSVLANAAHKVIGLTGTLYGGQASTIYAIEYLFNPTIRRLYPWGSGLNRWVKDMGVLERVVNYKPNYDKAGVYTGKRRIENKPKEAPGCSPSLVAEILDHCVFLDLPDIGRVMPDFQEIPVPIGITPTAKSGTVPFSLPKCLLELRLSLVFATRYCQCS